LDRPWCVKPQWQEQEQDGAIWAKMKAKLQGVLQKGYIGVGEVQSLTSYFAVLKGSDDIRMV